MGKQMTASAGAPVNDATIWQGINWDLARGEKPDNIRVSEDWLFRSASKPACYPARSPKGHGNFT
ncbi:MAG: hypothetical protein C4582_05525 [Desulfobacteraceae bacterium]|nr:MAG: hypothetical protein C4582_05525 [Desulfobacteraceae bacterium]